MNTPDTTKATPEPWRLEPFGKRWQIIWAESDDEDAKWGSATCEGWQAEEHARIMLSAPALLAENQRLREALQALQSVAVQCEHFKRGEPYHHLIEAARSALAERGNTP